MIRIGLAQILLLFSSFIGTAQPMIGHYLGDTREANRGRKFQSVEENFQVLLDGVSSIPYKVVKTFNASGYKVLETTYGKEGGVSKETKWEYKEGGKLIQKNHRYFVNMIGWREELVRIEYNHDTDAPERIISEREEKLFQKANIILDTLGRVELVQVYNNTGTLTSIEKLIYLLPANMIRVLVHRPNNQFIGTWSYPIDPSKEFSISSVSQMYYPNGDVRIETLTDAAKGDQAYYYEYEYDAQGNWIEKETYQVKLGKNNKVSKKKLEHRITRKINYY